MENNKLSANEIFNKLNDSRVIKWDGLSDGGKWDRALEAMLIYASNERTKAIQEIESMIIERIRNAGNAEQNGGAEYYPFDSMTLENIVGMRRAYSELKLELSKL